jgi:hypothetical protein
MARVIALMALVALGVAQAPVHEPVHGRRQAISAAVTQRSGPGLQYNGGPSDDLAEEIRNQVHEVHFVCPRHAPTTVAELSRI